jgi:hypothetical protein
VVACSISPGANFWTKSPEKARPGSALGYARRNFESEDLRVPQLQRNHDCSGGKLGYVSWPDGDRHTVTNLSVLQAYIDVAS